MLTIYNSLTKQKEAFQPINPRKVSIYVCGMTVYDYCHLGHARVLVSFDIITRYLSARGYDVTYVRNITDIDDKIIRRAAELNQSISELTNFYIDAMHEDERALGLKPPNIEPRATQHIPEMIQLIQRLIDNNAAYIAENGDVYYDISTFADYGKLSRKDLSGQQDGARIDIVDVKRNPADFVLWKLGKPGEPEWDSPWGAGRPGWHIECSAMSMHCLGETFDIHGGGFDLQFPHHDNEIAQSEGATHQHFVNTWMHVGYLQINREKMSKSLGNFFTIRDVLKDIPAEVVRYFLLASHYRSQLNFSHDNLASASAALERFYLCLRDLPSAPVIEFDEIRSRFYAAMDDDFNTPLAIAILFELVTQINAAKQEDLMKAAGMGALLRELGEILGILQQDPQQFFERGIKNEDKSTIENLIQKRNEARQARNFAEADALRAQLQHLGVEIEDTAEGTKWRKVD